MASAFILVFTADGAMRAAKNVFAMQDEVLQSMQQKLDDLFDEMNSLQQQYVKCDSFMAAEQELYNLQKECEEKDAAIRELAAAAHASSAADAKRIAELQDILKRKNMVISKLKKDMPALKQMVVELMRAKRTSVNLNPICSELPVMPNNVLYDMSSTSTSSSDSESPVAPREYLDEHLVDGTP